MRLSGAAYWHGIKFQAPDRPGPPNPEVARLCEETCTLLVEEIRRCLEFDEFHVQVETAECSAQEDILGFLIGQIIGDICTTNNDNLLRHMCVQMGHVT